MSFSAFGQSLIGRGADIIILDDPVSPSDAQDPTKRGEHAVWLQREVTPRLNDRTTGRIILVMQRLHPNDLSDHLLRAGEPCLHISLPAIAETNETWTLSSGVSFDRLKGELLDPERLSLGELRRLLLQMGACNFKAQFQQQPLTPQHPSHELRTGAFYYPLGHPKARYDERGRPDWWFGKVSETHYILHELFGEQEAPRRYLESEFEESLEEWEADATEQQRRLIEDCRGPGAPPQG
ncbi:hypothetical protein JNW90_07390 [Micromonospora sp. STR1s_5]|nr:hypothetical protein [Micromonospora sp. STR1s_5]